MKINYNYKLTPNFKSDKLNNLTLRKKLPNGAEEMISAELYKLEALDLPMVEKLYKDYPEGKAPKFLKEIKDNFVNTFSPQNKNLSHNRIFLMIKQNGVIQALCAATVKPKEIYLDYISNLDRANGIKGAGTAIIIKLAELAKKMNKPEINLEADKPAIPFYEKLKFTLLDNTEDKFHLEGKPFEDFLSIFQAKYFCKK